MKSFNREKFLLILLASIFAYQATVFAFGVFVCTQIIPKASVQEICPDLGTRYDSTFQVMIATTLALLTGGAALSLGQRTSSDRKKPALKDEPSSWQMGTESKDP